MFQPPNYVFSVPIEEPEVINHLLDLIKSGEQCAWNGFVVNVEQLNHGARAVVKFIGVPKTVKMRSRARRTLKLSNSTVARRKKP